jgi:hypothetical protein
LSVSDEEESHLFNPRATRCPISERATHACSMAARRGYGGFGMGA